MRHYLSTRILLSCLVGVTVLMTAGFFNIGGPKEKYERQVQLTEPLQAGGQFAAKTHNGSIKVAGADVADCNVIATIVAGARTEEKARRLAEEVIIKLQPSDNKLTAKIKKPIFMRNQYVKVNLDVTVPKRTSLELKTHNGAMKVADVRGRVDGRAHNGRITIERLCGELKLRTHNGSVNCKEISGDMRLKTHNGRITAEQTSGTASLETHNGSINCKQVSGDIKADTHNGKVEIAYAANAPAVCKVLLTAHNGGIDLTAPQSFSAAVEVSTHNGSIKTELPIMITGKLSKRKLTGSIGTGEGKLYLKTHNGSVKIR